VNARRRLERIVIQVVLILLSVLVPLWMVAVVLGLPLFGSSSVAPPATSVRDASAD
jgi:hypothetical protein